MTHSILTELAHLLLKAPVEEEEAFQLASQLLTWVVLSQSDRLDSSLRFKLDRDYTREQVASILSALKQQGGLIGQAFADELKLEPFQYDPLKKAIERLHYFVRTQQIGYPLRVAELLTQRGGELPPALMQLMVDLAGLQAGDSLYLPWQGAVALLPVVSATAVGLKSIIVESRESAAAAARVALLLNQPVQLFESDPILLPSAFEEGELIRFNRAIALAPLGGRYDRERLGGNRFNRWCESTTSSSLLAIGHLLVQSRERAVVAVATATLFSGGVDLKLRRDLLDRRQIQTVIFMPAGLLPNTPAPFALLILAPQGGCETIRLVNVDNRLFVQPTRTRGVRLELINLDPLKAAVEGDAETEYAITVTVERILKQSDYQLQPQRYLPTPQKQGVERYLAEAVKLSPLGEIAQILRPAPVGREVEGDPAASWRCRELGLGDLPEYGVITAVEREVSRLPPTDRRGEVSFLRPNDLVLSIRGAVGRVGLVSEAVPAVGEGGWLAGQSFAILRLHSDSPISAAVLLLLLRSPLGRALLRGVESGASIKMVQLRELNELKIPIPSAEQQQQVQLLFQQEVARVEQIRHLYQQQQQAVAALWPLDEA